MLIKHIFKLNKMEVIPGSFWMFFTICLWVFMRLSRWGRIDGTHSDSQACRCHHTAHDCYWWQQPQHNLSCLLSVIFWGYKWIVAWHFTQGEFLKALSHALDGKMLSSHKSAWIHVPMATHPEMKGCNKRVKTSGLTSGLAQKINKWLWLYLCAYGFINPWA